MTIVVIMAARKTNPPNTPRAMIPPIETASKIGNRHVYSYYNKKQPQM